MQSQREWIECAPPTKLLHIIVERQRCCINDRADVTLFTQVMQIGRKPIAQINHRRGQTLFAEDNAPADARLGSKLPEKQSFTVFFISQVWRYIQIRCLS